MKFEDYSACENPWFAVVDKAVKKQIEYENLMIYSILLDNYTEEYMRFLIPALINEHIDSKEILVIFLGEFYKEYKCKNKIYKIQR